MATGLNYITMKGDKLIDWVLDVIEEKIVMQ